MPTYLLEIGTEELPADQVVEAQDKLKSLVGEALTNNSVEFQEVVTMGTPRRLACFVKGLAPVQSTIRKKVKGPKVQAAFDASGKATPAATGFAQKQGITVEQLSREDFGGVEHLVADVVIKGRPSGQVLSEIIPDCVLRLSGERLMRWGASDLKFSRPIRWMVSLLDDKELPIRLDGIKSGRKSFGNRVLAPEALEIESPESYVSALRTSRVLVDPQERQTLIEEQVTAAATKLQGRPRKLHGSLLNEVLNILEWPHAIVGEFEKEYLALPDTLIETIMVHHQRYFPVESGEGSDSKLMPYFITVANNDRPEAQRYIKQGNERVIRARLADGRFFYFDDQKTKLSDRKAALGQLTFQEGLGSYLTKTERLLKAAREISTNQKLDAKHSVCLERTLELAKLDLVTNLVRELPELQGYVGSWYAAKESEPPEVVTAITSHYQPRSSEDKIPADKVGCLASLIDKLDNLVGLFALGRRPSGSSDPFGLRRNAQGVVDVGMDGLSDIPVNLHATAKTLLDEIHPLVERKKGFDFNKTLTDLYDFLLVRVRSKLQEKGIRREVIEAVCTGPEVLQSLPNVLVRANSLEKLLIRDREMALIRAGVRVCNIVDQEYADEVDESVLELPAEKSLWQAYRAIDSSDTFTNLYNKIGSTGGCAAEDDYLQLMTALEPLVPELNKFFEGVMVNDPDVRKRANRHALLRNIQKHFMQLGNFPSLQPLLP